MKYLTLILLLAGCSSGPAPLFPDFAPEGELVTSHDFDGGTVEVFKEDGGASVIDVRILASDVQLRHTTTHLPATFEFGGYLVTVDKDNKVEVDPTFSGVVE